MKTDYPVDTKCLFALGANEPVKTQHPCHPRRWSWRCGPWLLRLWNQDALILFLSDNGASAEIMVRDDGHDAI